jgi:hypothetical protein
MFLFLQMSQLVVRTQRLSLTQSINVPHYHREGRLVDECRRIMLERLHNIPSTWGVMIEEDLASMDISESIRPNFNGPDFYFEIDLRVEYNVVGYQVQDVVFGARLKPSLSTSAGLGTRRPVEILGLPFSIEVKCPAGIPIEAANIIITRSDIRTVLFYIADIATYPHYTDLRASACPEHLSPTDDPNRTLLNSDIHWYSRALEAHTTDKGGNRDAWVTTRFERYLLDPYAESPKERLAAIRYAVAMCLGVNPKILQLMDISPLAERLGLGVKPSSQAPRPGRMQISFVPLPNEPEEGMDYIFAAPLPLPIHYKPTPATPAAHASHISQEGLPPLVCRYKSTNTPTPQSYNTFKTTIEEYLAMKRLETLSFAELFSKEMLAADPTAIPPTLGTPSDKHLLARYQEARAIIVSRFNPAFKSRP